MTIGCLLDYYVADDSDATQDMVLFCMKFFQREEVDLLEAQLCNPSLAKFCAGLGMVELGGNRIFYKPKPGDAFNRDQPWMVTSGTGDVILRAS
jgi:hypothetical protein